MARIDNLNAHIKKAHGGGGGLSWPEAAAESVMMVRAATAILPHAAELQPPPHHLQHDFQLPATEGDGTCLELKAAVAADCFKAADDENGGGILEGGGEYKILTGSPSSPSWMS